jgi:hypothetical protein
MTVKLKNVTRGPFVATLYHEHYCKNGGTCKCKKTALPTNIRLKDGSLATTVKEMNVPVSFRLAGGETREELEDAILQVPQVACALKARPTILRKVLTATPKSTANSATPGTGKSSKEESRSSKPTQKGSSKGPKVRS